MKDFSFRYRLRFAKQNTVSFEGPRFEIGRDPRGPLILLAAVDGQTALKSTRDLVLTSSAWSSAEEAATFGEIYAEQLALALVRSRLGVHPVGTVSTGMIFNAGLSMLEANTGQRVLRDPFGLSVYETNPTPRFARVEMGMSLGRSAENLKKNFSQIGTAQIRLSHREMLAIDFYNLSFLQESAEVRLICLVIALESLLELQERSQEALDLVDLFVRQTESAQTLVDVDRRSILGVLSHLRRQSIRQAGGQLARMRMNGKLYKDLPPDKFFDYSYDLRSKLVHGADSQPPTEEIRGTVSILEEFVSDAITQPYFVAA